MKMKPYCLNSSGISYIFFAKIGNKNETRKGSGKKLTIIHGGAERMAQKWRVKMARRNSPKGLSD